jgi:Ca-activated chloride channel family protein
VSFLTPAAFVLVALIPVVIAMYLLRLRRTEQVVSSIYLWRRMVRDLEANAPWQRLRRNWLLILQLLFLAFLILALARPFTWAQGASGQALILILDTSASMAATDLFPNRLEAAKAQARSLVDGQPDDARITLITAGDGTQVLVASSQDRRGIHRALDDLEAGTGGSDLAAALELASAVSARQPETEILVLSDGRATLPQRPALAGQVRYMPVGQSGDNQAISTLALEPAPGGGELTAFAQVTNYGADTARRRLTLYADGQLVNAYDLEIRPGDQRAALAHGLPEETRVLEAQLDGGDALPLDDRAWAVHRDGEPTAVTLVTEGNRFLETGLSLLPGLEVTTVRPEDYEEGWKAGRLEEGRAADNETNRPTTQSSNLPTFQPSGLTIFDTYVPITATLPTGDLLFIAPPRGTELFTVTGRLDQPLPRPVDAEDPLLDHVNLAEVDVLDAVWISSPPWARPTIVADLGGETTPLLFAGETDGRRVAVLAFDLRRSDLPLQVAFPLLLANLTGWLAPGGGTDLPTQVAPGTAVSFTLPPETEVATVTRPDGSSIRLIPDASRAVFADTAQLGVYEVTWQGPELVEGQGPEPVEGQGPATEGDANRREATQAHFAVNLFSPQESDVQPAEALPVLGAGDAQGDEPSRQVRREWWRALALIALALLLAEWLVYQRAALVRLWTLVTREK